MTVIMKAKDVADQIYGSIRERVDELKKNGLHPQIATILIEGDSASAYYAQAKKRIADKLGVSFQFYSFAADVTEKQIRETISRLNNDPRVHGIMLELPLPKHISASSIVKEILPAKDIDGVTPFNKQATITGDIGLMLDSKVDTKNRECDNKPSKVEVSKDESEIR